MYISKYIDNVEHYVALIDCVGFIWVKNKDMALKFTRSSDVNEHIAMLKRMGEI